MESFNDKVAALAAKYGISIKPGSEMLALIYDMWIMGYNEGWEQGANVRYSVHDTYEERMKKVYLNDTLTAMRPKPLPEQYVQEYLKPGFTRSEEFTYYESDPIYNVYIDEPKDDQ